jgi:hypothetical protein
LKGCGTAIAELEVAISVSTTPANENIDREHNCSFHMSVAFEAFKHLTLVFLTSGMRFTFY